MAKKYKRTKKAKNTRHAQSKQENRTKTWVVVTRWILIALLVLGLTSSLFLGVLASAYALPQTVTQQGSTTQLLLSQQSSLELQTGDRIDGNPAEDYLALANDLPAVEAPMAGLCTSDGRLLFERNIDTQVPMASTAKMMTALVALETMELTTPLLVTYGAANTGGSSAGLKEGMVIELLDCLYALLLPSGNDAAVVIAENNSGMESRFVELMNTKAAKLGMSSTHYSDASGLSEEDQYTTVRDYLLLARECMRNATFRQIVGTSYHEAEINGTVLGMETTDNLKAYMSEAEPLGIKTGYTDEAGFCFVGAAILRGIEVYSVVFKASTAEQRFADTAQLLEWGLRHYRSVELINTKQEVAKVALLSWIDKTTSSYVPAVVQAEVFDLAGPITQEISINAVDGEASEGKTCGEIVWSQGGEVLTTAQVVVGETVPAPDFWEGIGIAWERFWSGFGGTPAHAETTVLLKDELAIPAAAPQEE